MAKVSIMAPGGWSTALGILCHHNGLETVIWGKFEEEIDRLRATRENPLLKGVVIPNEIALTSDIDDVVGSDFVILATPSFAVRETAARLRGVVAESAIIIIVSKGLERGSLKLFSEVIAEELPHNPLVVLSGPSHAEEVARGIPTSVVAASVQEAAAKTVQQTLMCDSFRIYTGSDVVGVEIGGALKNIIAMAAGACDGLGLGDNTIAALMTRGIHEITRLGVKMGARAETFAGLSGIGDLIVTCTSRHSRNRRFGKLIGEGVAVDEAIRSVGMVVESYYATESAKKLAERFGVDMPIVNECYDILYCGGRVDEKIRSLMCRSMKDEV